MLSKAKDREAGGRPEASAVATDDVSFISSDMKITGECSTRGQLRIEGRIQGNIAATSVELAPSGQVDGDVVATGANGSKPFAQLPAT